MRILWHLRNGPSWFALLLLLCCWSVFCATARAAEETSFEDAAVVARGGGLELKWQELDGLLLRRHAMSQEGRGALRHLLETRVVEAAAKDQGLAIPETVIDERIRALEAQWKQSGRPGGLAEQIREARLSAEEFRYYLRAGMLQETLTRRALGLKDGAELQPDQTKLWIQEELVRREAAELAPPWDNQPVARARGVEIGVNDFVRLLRRRLEPSAVQNAAYQTLLERKVLERLPDAAPGKIEEYVQKEIERRRREAQADPKNKGVPFERLMAAQGLSVAALPLDPGLRVSALSKLWIDKAYSAEALKRAYADERKLYDDAYGEAVELSMIFLTGARFTNPLNPRSIDDAMASLAKLAREIPSFEEFQKRAAELSEDEATRKEKGSLGFVTPAHPRLPGELRELLQKRLASSPTPEQLRGEGLVGPISVSNGAVLLWLGQRRPAPTWEVMSGYVQRELRRRFLEEALPRASVSYSL
ncbi:MAG: hypothetical protein RL277_3047 [Planctomycetota bacterium]|jgi:hypothetical protein